MGSVVAIGDDWTIPGKGYSIVAMDMWAGAQHLGVINMHVGTLSVPGYGTVAVGQNLTLTLCGAN